MSHISYPHDCIPSQSSTEDERFKVQNSCFQLGLTLGSARTTRVEREGSNMLILHSCMHHRQNWENFYWVSVSPNLSPLMSSVVLLPQWGEGEKKKNPLLGAIRKKQTKEKNFLQLIACGVAVRGGGLQLLRPMQGVSAACALT